MCCVPERHTSRMSSLTWTVYLRSSSLFAGPFENLSYSLGSCKRKEKEGSWGQGKKKKTKPAKSHFSFPSVSHTPLGSCCPSVTSQVTIFSPEPNKGQFILELFLLASFLQNPKRLWSKEIIFQKGHHRQSDSKSPIRQRHQREKPCVLNVRE